MQQLDLFDETLHKKMSRMEKWIVKIQQQIHLFNEEMYLIRSAHDMSKRAERFDIIKKQIEQVDMFGT